ncbi:neurofilament heavy polypeptide-like isoform X2 [Dendropsophus ebraccatus]|uniref:neurofilament heavy polypeptide-like isoform X2 n=1 Tax=Dendropsophus ebraccatus TaxID=150705 RepID=UPI003831ABC7
MAASEQERERGNMGAPEGKTQVIAAAATVKTPSVMRRSPYMKRSVTHPANNKSAPSRLSAPGSGARKPKTPSKSPSTGCTSAPVGSTRSPAGGAPVASTWSPAGRATAASTRSPVKGVHTAGIRSLVRGAPTAGIQSPVRGALTAGTRVSAGAPTAGTQSPLRGAPTAGTQSPVRGALTAGTQVSRGGSSVSVGVTRERHSASSVQKAPQMKCPTPYVLIPTRLRRTGLKLLDPEKVRNLTSRLPVSGDMKHSVILHQTTVSKQPPRSHRQNTLPRSTVRQIESSRKRTGITSRRQDINQSEGTKILPLDEKIEGHELSHQMGRLLLDDSGEVCNGPPPTPAQDGDGPHDRNSGQTVEGDAGSLEKSSVQEDEVLPLTDIPTTSEQMEETQGNDLKQDIGSSDTESPYPHTGDVQETRCPEDKESPYPHNRDVQETRCPKDKESPSQPSCQGEENQAVILDPTKDPPPDYVQSRGPDITEVDGPSDAEPTAEAEEKCQSSLTHLKDAGTSLISENHSLPNKDYLLVEEGHGSLGQNTHQDQERETGNQDKLMQHVWSRTNDIIRQSQGVLVLTKSTDEDAIFIPKLQFEFTPDNSIDWTALGPPLSGSHKGGPTKKGDPRVMRPSTPGGPTFSKSVLKKSFMLTSQALPGAFSESALGFSSAGDVTRAGSHPVDRIVDLSISFQGKFEEEKIPADIPKILLTEEDIDED